MNSFHCFKFEWAQICGSLYHYISFGPFHNSLFTMSGAREGSGRKKEVHRRVQKLFGEL